MPVIDRKILMWRYPLTRPFMAKYTRRIVVTCFMVTMLVYIVQPAVDKSSLYSTDQIADLLPLQITKQQISNLVAKIKIKNVETKRSDATSIFDSDGFYDDDDDDSDVDASKSLVQQESRGSSIYEDTRGVETTLPVVPPPVVVHPTNHKHQQQVHHRQQQHHHHQEQQQRHSWPVILPPSNARMLRHLDYSKYTPKERAFLLSRIPVYEERARIAAAACASRPDVIQEVRTKITMVWDTKHQPNIVWCPNYKVASTTMMINFLRLGHFNEDNPEILKLPEDQREEARFLARYGAKHPKVFDLFPTPKSGEEKYQVFTNALRVILVRHPFTRLLSAYRDKMTRMSPRPAKFHFRDLQIQIIKKYRPLDSNETSQHPTFAEYAQHVIDSTRKLRSIKDWRKVNCWTPYWVQCSSCNSDHNVIMKLETMKEDERFLFTISDLKELKEMKQSEWRHLANVSSSDAAPEFYRQLTRRQMVDLYDRYMLDFQMYGYHIQDYLAIAKDTK